MALSRNCSSRDSQMNAKKASFPMGDQLQEWKSPFGFYTNSDMLVWLKGFALDPSDHNASSDSARELLDQSLNVRDLLFRIRPQRKRNHDQFLKTGKFTGLATEKSDVHSVKRMDTSHSGSCVTSTNANNGVFKPQLVNSRISGSLLTFEDESQGKPSYPDLAIMDMENNGPSCKDNFPPPLIDTDESNNGLTTLCPENLNICDEIIVDVDDTADSPDTSTFDEYSSELGLALKLLIFSDDYLPRSIPVRDVNASSPDSELSWSKEQNLKVRKVMRLLFLDKSLPRAVVPIGPCFQAEVPEWTGPVNRKKLYGRDGDSEALKWLGTRMWPMKCKRAGTIPGKELGEGRSNSCSCTSPGSVACVKHHIHEAIVLLQSEIGPVFRSWKFDEMGESISKSWTENEQRTFESIVKMNPLSNEADFWKIAFKRFPSKSRKSIVNYYFNVFILRRMSLLTRTSSEDIDSDVDQAEEEQS